MQSGRVGPGRAGAGRAGPGRVGPGRAGSPGVVVGSRMNNGSLKSRQELVKRYWVVVGGGGTCIYTI